MRLWSSHHTAVRRFRILQKAETGFPPRLETNVAAGTSVTEVTEAVRNFAVTDEVANGVATEVWLATSESNGTLLWNGANIAEANMQVLL